MSRSKIEIREHYIPHPHITDDGRRTIRLYIRLRWSEHGVRNEKKTGMYYIVPEHEYRHRGDLTVGDALPMMFKKCSFSEERHNKHVMKEIGLLKAEVRVSLHYDAPTTISVRDRQRDVGRMEFLPFYDRFIDYTAKLGRAEGTVRNYQQSRDVFAEFRPKGLVTGITSATIVEFQTWMREVKGYSVNTVARHVTALSVCLRWLEMNDELEKSPFRKLRRGDRIHQDSDSDTNPTLRDKSFFHLEDLRHIWEERMNRKRREELDSTLGWLFSTMTGLRFCDAETLTPSEIKTIAKDGKEYLYIDKFQGKTKRKVYVPLNHTAQMILEEVKQRNPTSHIRLFRIRQSRTFHFIRGTDKKIRYNNARHSFNNNLKLAGVQERDIDRLSGSVRRTTQIIFGTTSISTLNL
jgi:site-specific recombinase XerD